MNKYIYLILNTPNYQNKEYKKAKKIYNENIYNFHKNHIKLKANLKKNIDFSIDLFNYQNNKIANYKKLIPTEVFKKTSKIEKKDSGLSLYADYNPKTTISGFGFKNKEKAIYTINKIKDQPLSYQKRVITTMIHRAKNHPHLNNNMKEAIEIFIKWKKDIN